VNQQAVECRLHSGHTEKLEKSWRNRPTHVSQAAAEGDNRNPPSLPRENTKKAPGNTREVRRTIRRKNAKNFTRMH